jgi:hypothetical protein
MAERGDMRGKGGRGAKLPVLGHEGCCSEDVKECVMGCAGDIHKDA